MKYNIIFISETVVRLLKKYHMKKTIMKYELY